ncbi:MAG: MBL fold metallo-hydrolase [Victivallales bacterium]|jgi:L-ascorbate metabolism protein UlaG (beta-lactamase superfamily)
MKLKVLMILAAVALALTGIGADEQKQETAAPAVAKGPVLTDLYDSIKPSEIPDNPIKLIGADWMLVTAGNQDKFNSMTASWGGYGVWDKPVTFILVHSDRYTYQFLEKEEYYTLSFYDPAKYRDVLLKIFGRKSGRDTDKVKESGFTPIFTNPGIAYAEARMIIVCKKKFSAFTGAENKSHKLFFGEIVSVWVKKLATAATAALPQQGKIGDNIKFTPIEHASVVIQTKENTIFVDPVGELSRYARFPKPDIILTTHSHADHFNPAVTDALKGKDTVCVGPKDVTDNLGYGQPLKNGAETTVKGVRIEAIPAYNTTADRMEFHPKGRDNGYVLNMNGKRIYISGDTEDIKEMRQLRNIDSAFLCMNLPYSMTEEQAASAVLEMKPKEVIPYHYSGRNGMSDPKKFKRLVSEKNKDINVLLMDWYGESLAVGKE